MLESARAVLETRPDDALQKLNAHRAAFPAGQLGIERELLAVDALRRLGRYSEARARCDELLTRARGSIYERRVESLSRSLP